MKKKEIKDSINDGRFPDDRVKEYTKLWREIEKAVLNNSSYERAKKEKSKLMYDRDAEDLFERGFVNGAKSLRLDIEKAFQKYIDNPELLEK